MTNPELLKQAREAVMAAERILCTPRGHVKITHAEAIELLRISRKLDCAATALECDARGLPQPKIG